MIKRKLLYKPQHPNCFPSNGMVLQYIYIATQKLNRPLNKGEVVHHIDCDPTNNSPQNLMVFTNNAEHTKFHKYNLDTSLLEKLQNGSYKIIDGYQHTINRTYICSYCGKQFVADWNRKSQNQYCSQDCYQKSQHRFELTIKQLENLVKQYSLSQIGRMYGVSCNAIKKRCLKYNIDYKQYEQQIKSKNMKKVMQQKYKDHVNPKQICPICGKWKKYNSKTCRDCYINITK